MYLRIGNMYKDFIVEKKCEKINTSGKPVTKYESDGSIIIKGCLAKATPEEKEKWRQLNHPISHTIVQTGSPKAKAGDRLVLNHRIFYIQNIDNADEIGIATIYYAEEREDVK